MEDARKLMEKKGNIEQQIEAQISVLEANSSSMQSPLIDEDGFPRADIDVYAVRNARVRIIELRNDLKAVTNEIGKALETVYNPENAPADDPQPESKVEGSRPFAKINGVAPQSPAAEAGLQREDLVLKFGSLDHSDFSLSSLQPLADLVAHSENKNIMLKVLRDGRTVFLNLSPKAGWGGRGTLGCHIVPYSP